MPFSSVLDDETKVFKIYHNQVEKFFSMFYILSPSASRVGKALYMSYFTCGKKKVLSM